MVPFDDNCDGALEQGNGNNKVVLILDTQENAFRAHEWTSLQPDPLAPS
jgi:hypothetical protein